MLREVVLWWLFPNRRDSGLQLAQLLRFNSGPKRSYSRSQANLDNKKAYCGGEMYIEPTFLLGYPTNTER